MSSVGFLSAVLKALSKAIRTMPYPIDQLPKTWRERERRTRIKEAVRQDRNEKVFGIGLSRTGTTSLSRALTILGYDTADWMNKGRVSGWSEFYEKDAVTDTPCSLQFESLYFTFEKSKFIYTTRNRPEWKRSIKNHYCVDRPSRLKYEWKKETYWKRDQNWEFYNSFKSAQIQKCLYAGHETWQEAYESYDERVRTFFENKPEHRFLVMNIPDGDGWSKLCTFLGVDIPDQPFPHENRSGNRQ